MTKGSQGYGKTFAAEEVQTRKASPNGLAKKSDRNLGDFRGSINRNSVGGSRPGREGLKGGGYNSQTGLRKQR